MHCAKRSRLSLSLVMIVAITIAWWPRTAAAHAEHYGQSAYLHLDREHVKIELDLSPGARVASQVVELIDTNHDGRIDDAEGRAYAGVVLSALTLQIDGEARALAVTEAQYPPANHLATGEDKLGLAFVATFPALAPGPHQVRFSNGYHPVESAYLAHAFTETKLVVVGKQARDTTNQELTVEYRIDAPVSTERAQPAAPAPWRGLALGIGFVAALGVLAARSRRRALPARVG